MAAGRALDRHAEKINPGKIMHTRQTIQRLIRWIFPLVVVAYGVVAHAEDEVSLFDASGRAQAYIALDDEMTIYTWSGTPAAYLEKGPDGYNVYGFNGKHLGWFVKGAIYGHDGTASCATSQVMTSITQIEPIKSIRHIKPIQSITQIEPIQPILASRFGDTPCNFLLGEGTK